MLSLLYGPTLTSIHDYWKTIALTIWTFVGKGMSLLFNMLSRFVTEKAMAPHSSILAWKNPIDTGAWWTTVHRVSRSLWDLVL